MRSALPSVATHRALPAALLARGASQTLMKTKNVETHLDQFATLSSAIGVGGGIQPVGAAGLALALHRSVLQLDVERGARSAEA